MVKITFDNFDETPATPVSAEPVRLSDSAAARIETIMKKKEKKSYLRIAIQGGGCNGFSYKFKLVNEKNNDDKVVVNEHYPTIQVIIDEPSYLMMTGSVIDFEETLEASQFVIKNPNAKSECGCGSSFGV